MKESAMSYADKIRDFGFDPMRFFDKRFGGRVDPQLLDRLNQVAARFIDAGVNPPHSVLGIDDPLALADVLETVARQYGLTEYPK
jgi:hypothetical protein